MISTFCHPERSEGGSAFLFAVALVLALTGCTLTPHYRTPTVDFPATFKEPPPAGWKQAQPNEAVDRGKWWEIYNDAQLSQLEDQVAISNENIKLIEAQYREARDNVRIARSGFFPTLSVAPAVTSIRSSATLNPNQQVNFISGARTQYNLPFDASYQADLWGSIRASVTAQRYNAQFSAATLANARLTFQAQLANFYFQIRGLDAERDLLTRTVAAFQESVDLTQARFEAGVVSQSDVVQAQAQLATAKAQLVDVEVARNQFAHAIAVLTGKAPARLTLPPTLSALVPPVSPPAIPSALLERRPDIAAAERQAAAANQQIGIARAAFFPALSLTASFGLESTKPGSWFTWPSRFWTAGPQLAETLFDAGKRRAQLDFERAAYDAAAANYRQTVLTAFQQVEDQLSSLRVLETEAQQNEEAVRLAQQSLDLTTEQYKAGTVNYLNVLTAQTTLLQNQLTSVNVATRRMLASVSLTEALGGDWNITDLPRP